MPFLIAQRVTLSACSPHCSFNAERQQGSCEYQLFTHWFDPTPNQTRVFSSRGRRSIHSAILKIVDIHSKSRSILKIVDIYKLETAIFMYKYRTNKLPAGMNNLFQETSQVHTKCTRTANLNNYFIPFYRTNRLQNSIQYQGAKLWNSIDPKIRNLKSLNQFKTNYKFLLLNDY